MDKDNVFDRLVKDLSSQERVNMLEKMEQTIHVNQDPIDIHVENEAYRSIEEEYKRLSWLEKLLIFFKTLFFSQDKLELTKKHMLNGVARKISYMNSEYFNIKKESVTNSFYSTLSELGKSIEFLKKPLADSFNFDKLSFYLLLGKLEYPQVHKQLENDLDPWTISKSDPTMDVQDVRKKLSDELESVIVQISRDERLRMLESTRVLYHMYQLSLFPFHQVLEQFPVSPEGEILPSSFSVLSKYLNNLGQILKSFHQPPGLKLLEAVFLSEYARQNSPDLVLEDYLKNMMVKAEYLMERIREFNRNVYLLDLLKLINEDPFYVPEDIGGGEDWFHFYLQYWQDSITTKMKVYIRKRLIETEKTELIRYWNLTDVLVLNNYNPSNKYCSYAVSMAVVNTFFKEIVQKTIYYPLNIIMVDGEFYKKNNRAEFEDSFNGLMKLGDRIRWFEHNLEPDGDGGLKIRDAINDSEAQTGSNEDYLLPIYRSINRDALMIVEEALKIFFSMGKLLNGIVLGNGGTYDTLANLSELGGRENEELRASIQAGAEHIQKIAHSLQDLVNKEKEGTEE